MKLTVIIPHYNHSDKLVAAFSAIAASTRKPDQVIVVDDGSNDEQCEQAKVISAHFGAKFVALTHNTGVPGALNRGIESATGDWVYFGAADDTVHTNFFAQAMQAAERHPTCGVVSALGEWVDEGGARIVVGHPKAEYVPAKRCGKIFIPSHAAIYRRTPDLIFFQETGPFSDWVLSQIASLKYGVAFTGTLGGRFNLASGTYYHRGDNLKALNSVIVWLFRLGIVNRVQLHVLGMAAFALLPADLRTFKRWCQFRWHALKAKHWRKLPQWVLDALMKFWRAF